MLHNFQPADELTTEKQQKALQWVLRDGLAAQALTTLTGGAFLVSFALLLGASNAQIGLIAALPTVANIFQLSTVRILRRIQNRKLLTVGASFFGRLMYLPIALLPLWLDMPVLPVVILLLMIHHSLGAISAGSWSAWMRDLIPGERLGSFFSHRLAISQALGVVLSLLAAFYLDYVELRVPDWQLESYAWLFSLGALCGLLSVYLLYRTPEPRMKPLETDIFSLLRKPFQHLNFRNLIIYQATWNFAVNLAAPFFTVYLLKRLDYSLTYVIAFTVLSQLCTILFLRLWGRYADTYSNKAILGICAPLYLFCILLWTFTTLPDAWWFTMPLLVIIHILGGIATAGTSLAASSIGLKLSPQGDAIAYLSVMSFINSASAGLAPIVGGLFADFFLNKQLSFNISWMSGEELIVLNALSFEQWDFFFVISFVLGLYALHRLAYIEEAGRGSERKLLKEIRMEIQREMKGLSTVSGLRSMVHLPFSLYQVLSKKK